MDSWERELGLNHHTVISTNLSGASGSHSVTLDIPGRTFILLGVDVCAQTAEADDTLLYSFAQADVLLFQGFFSSAPPPPGFAGGETQSWRGELSVNSGDTLTFHYEGASPTETVSVTAWGVLVPD